jgi:hypothetical protein
VRIDDPGNQREADVGHAVGRLQLRNVVLLDLDSARPQFRELGREVVDLPAGLRLIVGSARRALGDR